MPISIPTSIAGISVPGLINGPLRLLYGNKYVIEGLKYPRNLGDDATRNHIIQFNILVPEEEKSGSSGKDFKLPTFDSAVEQIKSLTVDQATDTVKEVIDQVTRTDVKRKTGTIISLYIPDTVNVAHNYSYDEISLTGSLGVPYFLAQAGSSLGDLIKGGSFSGTLAPFAAKFGGDLIDSVTGAAGIGTQNVGDLLLRGMGQAINPQMQVLFRGVGFRSFQFDFTFTPHSKTETEEVRRIIKAFKRASAPEIVPTTYLSGAASVFFKVPFPFEIKFLYKGKENSYVHKINKCVLENINVDYGPNGWSTFNDGAPVQIKMTLQFKEIDIIDKNKIDEGY